MSISNPTTSTHDNTSLPVHQTHQASTARINRAVDQHVLFSLLSTAVIAFLSGFAYGCISDLADGEVFWLKSEPVAYTQNR